MEQLASDLAEMVDVCEPRRQCLVYHRLAGLAFSDPGILLEVS